MPDPDIELDSPNLKSAGYAITSPPATAPNCIAWVLGDRGHFWDPTLTGFTGLYDWPDGIPREDRIETWIRLFQLFGYLRCEDATLEIDTEKIVIYGDASGEAHHVAKQLPDGEWTSKLGSGEDIRHKTPDALVGTLYGSPLFFMSRPLGLANTTASVGAPPLDD